MCSCLKCHVLVCVLCGGHLRRSVVILNTQHVIT
jgi:hypothetical protein